MGYYLKAFIGNHADLSILTDRFVNATQVDIGQGLALIPMIDELFDEINNLNEEGVIENFELLNEKIEADVLSLINNAKLAYVEAEYFGGQGGQTAIVWNNNERDAFFPFGQNVINQVLKIFGVVANSGQDEFLTMGFGLHRHTSDWLEL